MVAPVTKSEASEARYTAVPAISSDRDHPDTLDTEESLAGLYTAAQPARAEMLYREAAEGYRRTLGAAHGDTIWAVIGLAQFWVDEKKFAQAESVTAAAPLLRDGYEGLLRTAAVAEDQEQIGQAGDLVGKAYAQWGKQPAETAEWKQRVAADRVRLAALQP
jgi:hypothetical protein